MSDQEPSIADTGSNPVSGSSAADDPVGAESPLSLEQQLLMTEQKAQEHRDSWLRALADAENMRKRAQVDIASAHKYAVENLADAMLPVKDSLESALIIENATLESLKAGVELTLKQLSAVFDKANLREINPLNEKFDPHRHQALSMVAHEGEPNRVVAVMQKGYLLHDRVLRPALVVISKPKDA